MLSSCAQAKGQLRHLSACICTRQTKGQLAGCVTLVLAYVHANKMNARLHEERSKKKCVHPNSMKVVATRARKELVLEQLSAARLRLARQGTMVFADADLRVGMSMAVRSKLGLW